MQQIILSAFAMLLLTACNGDTDNTSKISVNNSNAKSSQGTTSFGKTKIRNDIQLQAKDITVSQAFLLYDDDGKLVPETNETSVGKPVNLRLILDGGWKEKEGMVSLGASERIETSEGQVILDEKDLFKDLTSIRAQDAQYITLTANISQLNRLVDYFLVSFRVWDKNGPGEVTGSFRLYIN